MLKKRFERQIKKENNDQDKFQKFVNEGFASTKKIVLVMEFVDEIFRAIRFFIFMSLIPIACYLYIFQIYPNIPQSYGGGKPAPVILIIDTETVSSKSSNLEILFPKNSNDLQAKSQETIELNLLYSTSDAYYITSNNGMILALDKDIVKGIIWNP